MPMPMPHADEAEADFIARCAGDKTMNTDFPHTDQRVAVCYRQWRDRHRAAAKSALDGLRDTVATASRRLGS